MLDMTNFRQKTPYSLLRASLASLLALGLALGFGGAAASAANPAKPNDPLRVKQTYLDQIHMPEAWAAAAGLPAGPPVTVALVDTGVDLTHPDLQGKLTDGYNLLQPNKPPQDDNGHGTNVAGIIAAVANNEKGIAGIAPNVRIMPIKALEADGRGDEAKLGEGIRYAVDHGARIVVLSLGLYRYNEELARIVQYAEERGVLLVAAAGNEGNSVNYPAAYPSVVAVGGVDPFNDPEYRSNIGPEIDMVAPYDVFTTALGGGYEAKNGTSMAAPQVAAVAALAWSKYPWMAPYQLRSLLEQTAEDLGSPGWDLYTGFGLLRADRVLQLAYREDPYEPNDRSANAKTVPVNTMISAEFAGGNDTDWFRLDIPYDGVLNFTLETNDRSGATVVLYDAGLRRQGVYNAASGKAVQLPVKRGYSYVKLQAADAKRSTAAGYRFTTDLQIYRDPFEPNDKQYQAFVLPPQSQIVKGTFDHPGDADWFMLSIEQSGRLAIRLSTDTARMDPILLVEKKGEKAVIYDQSGNGDDETASLEVFPGDYYIRVSNQKNDTHPIMGEYTLSLNYTPKWLDPNEPNDKPYQASSLSPGAVYTGTFENAGDLDWFQLDVAQDSLLELRLAGIPDDRTVTATIVDNSLRTIWSGDSGALEDGTAELAHEQHLTSGTYYIKLQSDWPFSSRPYRLEADLLPLLAGYTDIAGHWAESALVEMTQRGIVNGYGNYRFLPDGVVTRAEAAAMLTRAFRWTKENPLRFPDVPVSHWAYSMIARAAHAGIVDGYPDGTFRPNASVTRMEMASMIAKSLGLAGKKRGGPPFADIDDDYWGAGILKQLKADGWIGGFPDGTFRPDRQATRAEFLTVLEKILNS
jgi:hypothetical protein